jgi:O-antigen ligase
MLLTGITDTADLASSYTATGFSGFRAASTLSGPLEFGAFCAIALLLFASFYRELSWKYSIPGMLIAGGLIASVTRMAWLAVLTGLLVIAVRTRQMRRLLTVLGVGALVVLLLIVPSLGLQDFIAATQKGYDPSAEGHVADLVDRYSFVLSHPLGVGAGMVGPRALDRESKALHVESAYLQIGMAYGWAGILLFATFVVRILTKLWKNSSDMGIAAVVVALAMSIMYFFSPIHTPFELNTWAWTLLGFGVREGIGAK